MDGSLFYQICYVIRYDNNKKTDQCLDDDLKKELGDILHTEPNENKEKIKLDLNCLNFEKQCYLINKILMKYNYIFRIFELKNNFHHLINENSNKKTIIR